jgi:predicted DNA-binding transcriptional regulator AlpA
MSFEEQLKQFGGIIRRRLGILNTEELAATLECSASAVQSWRKAKSGPRFCRLGRRIYYREDDIKAWAEAQAEREDGDVEEAEESPLATS